MRKYLECNCDKADHIVRFTEYDPTDNFVYMDIFLNHYLGLWRRLWLAIKYIFGIESHITHYDCIILTYNQIKKLNRMCSGWLNRHTSSKATQEEKLKVAKVLVSYKQKALDEAKRQLKEIEGGKC